MAEPDLSDETKFITLTTPGSTTANKIHTFAAPADAKLAANTTYHLLLLNDTTEVCRETSTPFPRKTRTTEEHQAGASGTRDGGETTLQTHGPPTPISSGCRSTAGGDVPAEEAPTLVSNNWSLTPSELGARDQFRLLFLSSTTRNATSSDIEDYNTFIQNRAAAGHTDIQAYSNGFKVVGCTEDDDARDNTGTTFTSSDKGVPIYWVNGNKVADQYQDFYDGSWDNASNTHDRNELGINSTNTSQSGIALGPAA